MREVCGMPCSCRLRKSKINIEAYADEVVVFSPSCSGLANVLLRLNSLLSYHFILINVSKTNLMVFNKMRNQVVCQATFFNGKPPLEHGHQYKYLDTTVISILNHKQDISRSGDSSIRRNGKFYEKSHSVDQRLKSK